MEYVALAGAIVTLVVGPLLAWWLKRWWQGVDAAIIAERARKEEEEAARRNAEKVSQGAGAVNESIDKQREAREKWARENPGVPHP